MVLLSLLLYLMILLIARLSGVLILFSLPWYGYIGLFIICMVIVRISFAVIRSFQDEFIQYIKAICSKKGVRQYMIVFSIVIILLLVELILKKQINTFQAAMLIPTGLVAVMSFFYLDYLPPYFNDNEDDSSESSTTSSSDLFEQTDDQDNSQVPETTSYSFEKSFGWVHNNTNYSISLQIRPETYEKCSKLLRVDYQEWAKEYVANGICNEVNMLARKLMQLGKPEDSYEEVAFVLSFTQGAVKYTSDQSNRPNAIAEGDYPKYPVETLVEEKGDCEDSSILGAAILKSMGYDTALVFLPGHCALGVAGASGMPGAFIEHNQTKYYYCETTAEGWKIGDLPEEYNRAEVSVQPVPNREFSMTA